MKPFTHSPMRFTLGILGISSILELQRLSGVNNITLSRLLCKHTGFKNACSFTSFEKVFRTVLELYEDKRGELDRLTRKAVLSNIRRWAQGVVESDIEIIRSGARRSITKRQQANTRRLERKRRQRYAEILNEIPKE